MNIFANGCSWTYGGSLNLDDPSLQLQRLQSVWPHHLTNLLNGKKCTNLAMGCGGNDRILRTTLDWVLKTPAEELKETLAIIQWSVLSRYEYYFTEKIDECCGNEEDRWALVNTNHVISRYENDSYAIKRANLRRELRMETYTELEGMYKLNTWCLALSNLFRMYNIRYFFFNCFCPLWLYPKQYNDFFVKNFNWLDIDCTYLYDRVSDTDTHPSFKGHLDIANLLKNEIESKDMIL